MTQHFIQQEKASCKSKKHYSFVLTVFYCDATLITYSLTIKQINGNYYTTKAPALKLVAESVTGWSECWKCNWTSPARSHYQQQILTASPNRTQKQNHVKQTISSFSTATYHQHLYQKQIFYNAHIKSYIDSASIKLYGMVDWLIDFCCLTSTEARRPIRDGNEWEKGIEEWNLETGANPEDQGCRGPPPEQQDVKAVSARHCTATTALRNCCPSRYAE